MNSNDRSIIMIISCVIIAILVIALIYVAPLNTTYNFNSTVVSQDASGVILLGNDGYFYVVCNPVYVDTLNIPNTTVYSRTRDNKRYVEEYEIPDVTHVKRVFCLVSP